MFYRNKHVKASKPAHRIKKALVIFFLGMIAISVYSCDHALRKKAHEPTDPETIVRDLANNKAAWDKQIAEMKPNNGDHKFAILKKYDFDLGSGFEESIVYDESDEIANIKSLHLIYYITASQLYTKTNVFECCNVVKSPAGDHFDSVAKLSPIISRHLTGHYYWIRYNSMHNGYIAHIQDNNVTIKNQGCKSYTPPITEICPGQLEADVWGNLSLNYN